MKGATTGGAGTAYPSGASEFTTLQAMVYKIRHRKLNIKQHELH